MDETLRQETIARIRQMEQYLDEVLTGTIVGKGSVEEALQELARYYDSGQWLHDYELDESGLLPADLKRGVLAEDTLYNVLGETIWKNE